MKPIKFRAWDKKRRQMVPVLGFDDYEVIVANRYDGPERYRVDSIKREDADLLQFTGLVDRTGREIYEGDVVRYDEDVYDGSVVWRQEHAHYEIHERRDGKNYIHPFDDHASILCEVIGNIHENPELLK